MQEIKGMVGKLGRQILAFILLAPPFVPLRSPKQRDDCLPKSLSANFMPWESRKLVTPIVCTEICGVAVFWHVSTIFADPIFRIARHRNDFPSPAPVSSIIVLRFLAIASKRSRIVQSCLLQWRTTWIVANNYIVEICLTMSRDDWWCGFQHLIFNPKDYPVAKVNINLAGDTSD